jgi:hypothetical protein
MILRFLGRFFRSSEYATRAIGADDTAKHRAQPSRRDAFHAHELATIPEKIERWKPWVDTRALTGTSPGGIQALADSSAFLSRALMTLVERAQDAPSAAVVTALGDDLRAWHTTLQEALGKLANDPTAGRAEPVRERLAEITTRLEARMRDAFDADRTGSLAPDDEERLYLLLAAYQSVSEALVDYVENARTIDWSLWREERFA